ncbi:hypothetical protein BU17DRAFT_93863 [Hysterangium stoloniferum]|nr:hypothetical protein BU17DRAFT_93863 [Hysterangium stoloniferum]
MGMLARLSLEEAEEGSESKLKRAATYDEDDFGTESESATTEGFGLALTDYHAPGPASNLAPKGLGNAPCPARYSFEWRCKGGHEIDEPAAAGYGRRAGSCLEACETQRELSSSRSRLAEGSESQVAQRYS